LAEVDQLTPEADFARFVGRDVDPKVRHAALKKLFTDPHYNVMDGLDIYIDDYHKADPLPPGMLRQLAQSNFLRLFEDADQTAATTAPQPLPPSPHEDADLRLQPDDDARCAGATPGTDEDARG
jgi:hypothetical protein